MISLCKDTTLTACLIRGVQSSRQSLNGRFGNFKPKAETMFLDDAVRAFIDKFALYEGLLNTTEIGRLFSAKGREYVRLKLEPWTKKSDRRSYRQ